MNKVQAPSLLLEDFNYLINKAINQFVNKRYNIYDVNQQTTDDLRVLKSTVRLDVTDTSETTDVAKKDSLYGAVYEFELPKDYLHLLNCVCEYKVNKQFKCYDEGSYVQFGATRLTSDLWSKIINNFYMRPDYRRPYYFIHNVNMALTEQHGKQTWSGSKSRIPSNQINIPTDPGNIDFKETTLSTNQDSDNNPYVKETKGGLSKTISINNINVNGIEKTGGVRYGNPSKVRLEIRYGKDNSVFQLSSVYVDYIKSPQYIRITQEQLDKTEDTSQIMEFPDYVVQEIINELVHIVMENSSDQRLQTHIPISQSIANPAQQQASK